MCLRPSALRSASFSACTPIDRRLTPADAIAAKPLGFDAGRIGFERDLRLFIEAPGGGDRVDDALHGLRGHQRGGAAAEKHRSHRPARRKPRPMGDFGLERREIARFVDSPAAHVAVEVAIGAFRQAERPMDIDPKAGIGGRAGVGARDAQGRAANHCDRYASELWPTPARASRRSGPKDQSWRRPGSIVEPSRRNPAAALSRRGTRMARFRCSTTPWIAPGGVRTTSPACSPLVSPSAISNSARPCSMSHICSLDGCRCLAEGAPGSSRDARDRDAGVGRVVGPHDLKGPNARIRQGREVGRRKTLDGHGPRGRALAANFFPPAVTAPRRRSRRCGCASPARSGERKSCRRRSGRCARRPGSPRSSVRPHGR